MGEPAPFAGKAGAIYAMRRPKQGVYKAPQAWREGVGRDRRSRGLVHPRTSIGGGARRRQVLAKRGRRIRWEGPEGAKRPESPGSACSGLRTEEKNHEAARRVYRAGSRVPSSPWTRSTVYLDLVHRIFGPGPLLPPGPGPAHMPSRAFRATLVGPGPASVFRPSPNIPWTRSTLLYQHDATSNADSRQNRVAHCKSCNEQRGNRPKPCYSLHAFPTLWRRFVVWMVLVCHMNGTGVPCRWSRCPLQLVQV